MNAYDSVREQLEKKPRTWLVTGVAGFIGSNLLEELLNLGQSVVGIDNFSTGKQSNLDAVRASVKSIDWARFSLIKGDIADESVCRKGCKNVNIVLHQAALGSVPRSLAEPQCCHHANVTGFLSTLIAAREAGVQRFVFASSSSVYGDSVKMPKVEQNIGRPLSPYAASKRIDEVYAEVFARCYNFSSIGLRYFNVFGKRQDPNGAYAAVIPRWIAALLQGQRVTIHGDGKTSRDFCFIENVVQANILAATILDRRAENQIYNIAVGERITLNRLFTLIKDKLRKYGIRHFPSQAKRGAFRSGDVRHSLADIRKAQRLLGYSPTHRVEAGLDLAVRWYLEEGQRQPEGSRA